MLISRALRAARFNRLADAAIFSPRLTPFRLMF